MSERMAAVLMSVVLGACGAIGVDPSDPTDPSDPVDPSDPSDPAPVFAASYQLSTHIDLTAAAVVPATMYEAIEFVRAFSVSPGQALVDAAEAAGVPAVGTLRDALPGALEDRLIGYLDDAIEETPLPALAAEIAALADTVIGDVGLASQLDLAPGQHAAESFAIHVAGQTVSVPVAALSELGTTATVEVTVDESSLEIGTHALGVRVGTAMWQGMEQASVAATGQTLDQRFAQAMGCPAVAAAVADQCFLGACIGHEADLLSICEAGAAYAVDQVQAQFLALDHDVLRIELGTATGRDQDGDRVYETVTGSWALTMDLSMGPRPVAAVFTGTRAP